MCRRHCLQRQWSGRGAEHAARRRASEGTLNAGASLDLLHRDRMLIASAQTSTPACGDNALISGAGLALQLAAEALHVRVCCTASLRA